MFEIQKTREIAERIEPTVPLTPVERLDIPETERQQIGEQARRKLEMEGTRESRDKKWWQQALEGIQAFSETGSGMLRLAGTTLLPGEQEIEKEFREIRNSTNASGESGIGILKALRMADQEAEGSKFKTPFDDVGVDLWGKRVKLLPSEVSWRGVTRAVADPLNIAAVIPGVGLPLRGALLPVTATARGAFGATKGLVGGALRGGAAGAARGAGRGFAGGVKREAVSMVAPERFLLRKMGVLNSTKEIAASETRKGVMRDPTKKLFRLERINDHEEELFWDISKFKSAPYKKSIKGQEELIDFDSMDTIAEFHGKRGYLTKKDGSKWNGDDLDEWYKRATLERDKLMLLDLPNMPGLIEQGGAQVMIAGQNVTIKTTKPQTLLQKLINLADPEGKPKGFQRPLSGLSYILNRVGGQSSFGRVASPVSQAAVAGWKMRIAAQNSVETIRTGLEEAFKRVATRGGARDKEVPLEFEMGHIENLFNLDGTKQKIIGIKGGVQFGGTLGDDSLFEMPVVEFFAKDEKWLTDRLYRAAHRGGAKFDGVDYFQSGRQSARIVEFVTMWQRLAGHTYKVMKASGMDVSDITKAGGESGAVAYFPQFVSAAREALGKSVAAPGGKLRVTRGTLFEARRNHTRDELLEFIDGGGRYDVNNLLELMTTYLGHAYNGAADARILNFINRMPQMKAAPFREKTLVAASRQGAKKQKDRFTDPETGELIAVKLPFAGKRQPLDSEGLKHPIWDPKRVAQFRKILDLDVGGFDSFVDTVARYTGIARTTQAGIDLGWWVIQGMPQLLLTPEKWGKNVKTVMTSVLKPGQTRSAKVLERHHDILRGAWEKGTLDGMRKGHVSLSKLGTDIFESTREGGPLFFLQGKGRFRGGAARWAKNVTATFQQRFELSNDLVRIDTWETFAPVYQNAVRDRAARIRNDMKAAGATEAEITQAVGLMKPWEEELGTFVRAAAGGFDSRLAGVPMSQQRLERAVLFYSPRYTRASMSLIAHAFSDNVTGEVSETLFRRMLFGGLMTHYNLSRQLGQEPNLDPSSHKFLSNVVEGNRVGFGGFWLSAARLFGEILEDPRAVYRGNDGSIGYKESVRSNPIVKFFRGRLAPLGSTISDQLIFGSDYLGTEFESLPQRLAETSQNMLPFALEAMVFEPRYRGGMSGVKGRAAAAGLSFMGLRQFPTSNYDIQNEMRDSLAYKYKNKEWSELTKVEQRKITSKKSDSEVRELDALEVHIIEKSERRGEPRSQRELRNEYFRELKKVQEGYVEEINDALGKWQLEHLEDFDSVLFRKNHLSPALTKKRNLSDALNGNPKYASVLEYFGSVMPSEAEAPEDLVFRLYMDGPGDVSQYVDDTTNEVNYLQRDIDDRVFWNSWPSGEQLRSYVQSRLDATSMPMKSPEYDDKVDSYYKGLRTYRYYWDDIPMAVINIRKDRDMALEYYNEWQQATKTSQQLIEADEVKGPVIRGLRSDIRKVREERRRIDPMLDAWLYRWGFTSVLKHPDNLDFGVFIRDYHYDRLDIPLPGGDVSR